MHGNLVSFLGGRMLTYLLCTSLNLTHTPHHLALCRSISLFNRTHPYAFTDHISHLLKLSPLPLYKHRTVHQKPGLLFVDFFSSAFFFFPSATQQNSHSYCHPLCLSFLLLTLSFLLGICFTQLAALNFNDVLKTQPRSLGS